MEHNFVLGLSWYPTTDGSVITASEAPFYFSVPEAMDFRDKSVTFEFKRGVGIPGRVWASLQPEWSANVQRFTVEEYPRVYVARQLGVKTSFGVPIIDIDGAFVGVVEFFKQDECPKDEQLLQDVAARLRVMIEMLPPQ